MLRFFILFSASWAFAFATSAAAQRYESQTLFSRGDWIVEITHDSSDGSLWCSAQSNNSAGQTFSLTAYQPNSLTLFVFDRSWNIAERPLRFLVDVDYSRWTMDGNGSGIGISLTMSEAEAAGRFLTELMEGRAVAVMNSDERRLAVFSLRGSSAAITSLFDCWDSISETDPFRTSSDPFN